MSNSTSPVAFVIATCDRERTVRFLAHVVEARNESKGQETWGHFRSAFEARLSFKALMSSPFTFLDEKNTRCMGYEDPSHAQHVSALHGWPKANLAFLRVELSPEAFKKLEEAGAIKNVSKGDKKIWSIDPFVLFELEEPDVKISIKNHAEVGL